MRLIVLDIVHSPVKDFGLDCCPTVPMEPVVSTIPLGPNAHLPLIA
jgi:hypothetical protein